MKATWVLAIAVGGAIGSAARYLVSSWVQSHATRFPIGTLSVNLIGSLLMGLIVGLWLSRSADPSRLQLAVTVGLLGGFTTYSSFALDAVLLLERKETTYAALYVFGSLLAGGIACFAGLVLGRRI